jgi:DNA-binding MarR family transcriptional regulator
MHERLCALKGILRAIALLEGEIHTRYGLTLTEALCLCSIGGGCLSAGSLAEEVALSPSRLSRVLSSLESKGLIERQRRDDDKRNWNNAATAAGNALIARMKEEGIEIPPELERITEGA